MRNRSTSPKTVESRLAEQGTNFNAYYNKRLEVYGGSLDAARENIMETFGLSVFTFNKLYDKHVLNTPQEQENVPPQYRDEPQKDNGGNGSKASGNSLEQAAALLELLKSQQTAAIDENKVKQLIQKEIENLAPHTIEIKDYQGNTTTLDNFTAPKEFDEILFLASQRENILLVGASGGGKTFIAHKIAEALKLPFRFISCSAGMSESHLNGKLAPIGSNMRFEFLISEFIRCYENGGLFLLDEGDAADANTLLVINAAIANGMMSVPNRYDNPIAKRHKDFILIMAANTYGNGSNRLYVGRNQLDASTLDRFCTVVIDYDKNVEKAISSDTIRNEFYPVRKAIEKLGLRRLVSTRFLKRITALSSFYDTPKKRFNFLTVNWSKDDISAVKSEANLHF